MKKITLFFAATLLAATSWAQNPTITTEWTFGAVNPIAATEGFEYAPVGGLPTGWATFAENVTEGTVTSPWVATNIDSKRTGSFSARMGNYQTKSDCWLITPAIRVETVANTVSFWRRTTAGEYGSKLEVYVSENATQPTASTVFTKLVEFPETASGAYLEETLDLSAYNGKTVYIGFKVTNTGTPGNPNAGGDNWWIDDVSFPVANFIGTAHNTRGLAYGVVNTQPVLAVVSRQGGNSVRILDVANGNQIAMLNVTGISGGAIAMNDACITADGKVLVSNVVNAAAAILKIYRWDNYHAAPTVALSYELPDASRYGDNFTVTGSIADGSAKVYVASSALVSGVAKVLMFSMVEDTANPGTYVFNNTPTVLSSAITFAGATPSIAPLPNGSYIFKNNGNSMRLINADGTLSSNASNNGVVATGGNSPQYIRTVGDSTAIVYFRFGAGQEKADVLKFADGNLANARVAGVTPSLGTNSNLNGTGRVVVENAGANDDYLYVLGTNNGIGKYKITWPSVPTSVKNTSNDLLLVKSGQQLRVENAIPTSMVIYNVAGQKLQAVANSNTISVEGLKGVHIVKMNVNGKTHTQKVVL